MAPAGRLLLAPLDEVPGGCPGQGLPDGLPLRELPGKWSSCSAAVHGPGALQLALDQLALQRDWMRLMKDRWHFSYNKIMNLLHNLAFSPEAVPFNFQQLLMAC